MNQQTKTCQDPPGINFASHQLNVVNQGQFAQETVQKQCVVLQRCEKPNLGSPTGWRISQETQAVFQLLVSPVNHNE